MGQKKISLNTDQAVDYEVQEKLQLARNCKASDIENSILLYEEVLKAQPEHSEALVELSYLHIFTERYELAYPHLKTALNQKPKTGSLWAMFGKCLYKLLYFDAAIMAFDKAEEFSHNSIQMQLDKAMSLMGLNRFDDSLSLIERLLKQNPGNNNILQARSVVAAMMGNVDIASESLLAILKKRPGEPSVIYKLSEMGRLPDLEYAYSDPEHEIYSNRKLSWQEKTFLYYARAIEDQKRENYDASFVGFDKANKIIRSVYDFDRDNLKARTDLHINVYNEDLLKRFDGAGNPSLQPIFIIGMPRSGTTLIEQILSSHSEIAAGGEVAYIAKIESSLVNASRDGGNAYPASMLEIDTSCLDQFAQQYLGQLQQCSVSSGRFITDKMPTNFLNLGLISLIFPNAKIIHARRNPIDTCLSCYFKRFVDLEHLSFTFDQEDLGFFYNEYLRLMAHWKSLLGERLIEVQYEDLVADQGAVTRQMLDYIGVEWEDACLKFYENKRGVATSSLHQVRKPMYKGAVGRWKRYEKHIGPLINALDQ